MDHNAELTRWIHSTSKNKNKKDKEKQTLSDEELKDLILKNRERINNIFYEGAKCQGKNLLTVLILRKKYDLAIWLIDTFKELDLNMREAEANLTDKMKNPLFVALDTNAHRVSERILQDRRLDFREAIKRYSVSHYALSTNIVLYYRIRNPEKFKKSIEDMNELCQEYRDDPVGYQNKERARFRMPPERIYSDECDAAQVLVFALLLQQSNNIYYHLLQIKAEP